MLSVQNCSCTSGRLTNIKPIWHQPLVDLALTAKPGTGKLVAGGEALGGAALAQGLAELRLSLQMATTGAAWRCGAARLRGFVLKLFLTKSGIGPCELPLVNLFLKDLLLC